MNTAQPLSLDGLEFCENCEAELDKGYCPTCDPVCSKCGDSLDEEDEGDLCYGCLLDEV
jgi:hypothetical protein